MSSAFSTGSYLGAVMLYPVFAAWAALTVSVMGEGHNLSNYNALDSIYSSYGGSLRFSSHSSSALGGVPVQVL